MDPVELGRKLWETGQACTVPPNTRDWWITVATTAIREIETSAMDRAAHIVESQLGAEPLSLDEPQYDYQPELVMADQSREDGIGPLSTPVDTEPTSAQAIAPEGTAPRTAAHRTMCSKRAQFDRPVALDRRFRPSTYGYSGEDFQRDYPHANPRETLEKFFSHHIANGTTSRNWLEKFFLYAATAERIAIEQAGNKTSTDSMGQPLDPAERARRVRVARQHAQEINQFIDSQIHREGNQ